jgi:hypothetical protein
MRDIVTKGIVDMTLFDLEDGFTSHRVDAK